MSAAAIEIVAFENLGQDAFELYIDEPQVPTTIDSDLQVLIASSLSREHAAEVLEQAAMQLRAPAPHPAADIDLQAVRETLIRIGAPK
jgi:endonuclease III